MRDVIIVLPGILGSVLTKHGRDVWGLSGESIWSAVRSRTQSLHDLRLDRSTAYGEDGVVASQMIRSAHLIPGFFKVDGYTELLDSLATTFDLTTGEEGKPGNFWEFPYDWRRDNREAANRLAKFANDALGQWKDVIRDADSRIILIAHSMGGLISRYFLEVLGGWEKCRALITFGTPYRGSVNALNFLANGYKQLFLDLTDVLRSCPSVYQLLPIYPMVEVGEELKRVSELSGVHGIEEGMAIDALAFHREIENAVTENMKVDGYLTNRYRILPFVGVDQPTLQSARLVDGKVLVSSELPLGMSKYFSGGDGTVPRCSGTPIELNKEFRETFFAERHSSLQCNQQIIYDVLRRIETIQASPEFDNIRESSITYQMLKKSSLSVDLEDAVLSGEPAVISVSGCPKDNKLIVKLIGQSISVSESHVQTQDDVSLAVAETNQFRFENLPRGLYRVEVSTQLKRQADPEPVHDIFEVV